MEISCLYQDSPCERGRSLHSYPLHKRLHPAGSFWRWLPSKRCKAKLPVVLRCQADQREELESVISRGQIAMASWSPCLLTPSCAHVASSLSACYSAFPSISPNQLTCNCFCSYHIIHMVLQLFHNAQQVPGVFFFVFFFLVKFASSVRACLWRDPSARWPRDVSILCEACGLHTEHHAPLGR